MNENNENKSASEDNESSKTPNNDDIKAFKVVWDGEKSIESDIENSDGKEPEQEPLETSDGKESEAEPQTSDEKESEAETHETSDEKESEAETHETADENIGENDSSDGDISEEPRRTPCGEADLNTADKAPKKDRSLFVACVLSACSVALLVLFAASLMLGLFPIGRRQVVFVGVSDSGATVPDTDASPELLGDIMNSVVIVMGNTANGTSTGTGVIVSQDGYIVTNYHVISDVKTVTVQLFEEDIAIKAEVVGFHADDDIAVLKIDRIGLRAAPFADSDSVRYGEKVYAIGNPEGIDFKWSITQGIVSCPLRELMIYDGEGILEKKMNVVQTDAPVNHGNSGGPLINVRGEIVGIVTLKRSESAGMGFALPADGVAIDVKSIIEKGHADNVNSGISVPRPLLGVTGVGVEADTYYKNVVTDGQTAIEEVTEEYYKANPLTSFYAKIDGVRVSAVSAGSDAAKHLRPGDILTEINGTPVLNIYNVMNIINQFNGGDKVTVKYYRDGKYNTVELTLRTSREIG